MTITREQIEMYASAAHATQTFEMDKGKLIAVEPEHMQQLARMALAGMEAVHKDKAPELSQVIYHFRDWNEGFPVERFKADYVISWMLANYPPAPQPLTTSERAELENYRNAQQVLPSEKVIGTFDAEKNELALLDKNMTVEKFAHWHVHNSLEVIVRPIRAAMLQGKADDIS